MAKKLLILTQSEYFRDPRVLKESISAINEGFEVDVACYQYTFDKCHPYEYYGVKIHRFESSKKHGSLGDGFS